jgi:catechol 2,3-dioxygenase
MKQAAGWTSPAIGEGDMTISAGETRRAYGIRPVEYRLPETTRVGAVHLQVSDLSRSLDYYGEVLGFRVLAQDSVWAHLGPQGEDRTLITLRERRGARPVPRRGLLGLYHFAVLLPDRAALGRFVTHLADIGAYAGSADHLVSEALYLSDPDGLGIEVYADRPRSEWRVSGNELAMTTDPLDLNSLVRAAGGVAWAGMPAGTVVGHVHLYVGGLREAEAFYHAALGLDKVVWSYPGALFMSAGGYHHHLGTNIWAAGAPAATDADARLIEWELVLPSPADVDAAASHIASAGFPVDEGAPDRRISDPWGTTVKLTASGKS